jgi:hypothetical protein
MFIHIILYNKNIQPENLFMIYKQYIHPFIVLREDYKKIEDNLFNVMLLNKMKFCDENKYKFIIKELCIQFIMCIEQALCQLNGDNVGFGRYYSLYKKLENCEVLICDFIYSICESGFSVNNHELLVMNNNTNVIGNTNAIDVNHVIQVQNKINEESTNSNVSTDNTASNTNNVANNAISCCNKKREKKEKFKFTKNFQFKFTKRENIDKKVLRHFRKFLKNQFSKKQNEYVVNIISNNSFWFDFINTKLLPPFNYQSEGKKFKSFNTEYMIWIFKHSFSLELYSIYINSQFQNILHYFQNKFNLQDKTTDNELALLKIYLNSMAKVFTAYQAKYI